MNIKDTKYTEFYGSLIAATEDDEHGIAWVTIMNTTLRLTTEDYREMLNDFATLAVAREHKERINEGI